MYKTGILLNNEWAKEEVDKLKFFKGIFNILKSATFPIWLGSLPSGVIDIIESIKLKDNPGNIAWKLILRSMTNCLCLLISETDFENMNDIITDNLETDLNKILENEDYYIDSNFFKNPEKSKILKDLHPIIAEFLTLFDLNQFQIENILNRHPSYFVLSLAIEWRTNYKYYSTLKDHINTPFDEAVSSVENWFEYSSIIKQQIDKPVFSERFSLKQIYIPLRAYYYRDKIIKDKNKPKLYNERNTEEKERIVVDLETELLNWIKASDKDDSIRIIRGGPGIGKSSFLKIFAAKLVENEHKVLFIPLHLFDVEKDLMDAIKEFLKDNEIPIADPFSADKLIIIFDGLDELSMQGKTLAEIANKFLQEVERKVVRTNNAIMKLQCLISGRDVIIQQNENIFRKGNQILRILPYFIEKKDKNEYIDSTDLLRIDQRNIWWDKFGKLIGKDYSELPEKLRIPVLDEITAQPLLNYLIALSFERGKIIFSKYTNLNEIYEDLLNAVYKRNYSDGKDKPILKLQHKDFCRMLEEIAMAAWHGDGRTTTVADIEKHFKDSGLKFILDNFVKDAEKGVISLLAAFYFRQSNQGGNNSQTFEFTHKSFGEYLTSKRIASKLIQINSSLIEKELNYDQGWDIKQCLEEWIKIFGYKDLDEDLIKFIENEIELCFQQKSDLVNQIQQSLIKMINHTLNYGMPVEKIDSRPNYFEENKLAINSEKALLIILGIISNLTKNISDIKFPSPLSFGEWINRLSGPRSSLKVIFKMYLNNLNLRGIILDYCNLIESNLTFSDLSKSKLVGTILKFTNLNYADLSDTVLYEAILSFADFSFVSFKSAYLENCDLRNSGLYHINFQNARLVNTNFENSGLDYANFENSSLYLINFKNADLNYVNFKNIKILPPYDDNREIIKDEIYFFINAIEVAKNVQGIMLDNYILEIIENEYPELFKRIKEGEPEENRL